jgi:uncharacterized protein UPF0158
MPPSLSLSEFVNALQYGDESAASFIDPHTGRIMLQREESEAAGYERVPVVTDQEELAFARQFAAAVADPHNRERLELALRSGNAHEAFEMALFRCQIANEWFPYRDQCLVQFAKNWLDARGLSYTDDLPRPPE